MHDDRPSDRGGSAIEVALLLAAMTVVLLPALVLLAHVVYDGFAAPCAAMGNDNCDEQSVGGSSGAAAREAPCPEHPPSSSMRWWARRCPTTRARWKVRSA